jgi:hypothetical protein
MQWISVYTFKHMQSNVSGVESSMRMKTFVSLTDIFQTHTNIAQEYWLNSF